MSRITESPSHYNDLEHMSTDELLRHINHEDGTVAQAVARALPQVSAFVDVLTERMRGGGRLFYIGAGTSGRLGIVDASECPPTFGVPFGLVVGLIAGGDGAIRKAVEFAEDDASQGWKDLQEHRIGGADTVVGIAASGSTPYVIGALEACRAQGIVTACITCNPGSPITRACDHPIVVEVGPEFVTGSTRMKSGTAQKLVLNMISTSVMIKLGHVKGNRMVDMRPSNNKLVDRGTRMIMEGLGVSEAVAAELLLRYGSVRKALEAGHNL